MVIYSNNNYIKTPKISVVTVVYNGALMLEETIQSVISQTYTNVEYIIIDGASTDSTVDIIKQYASYLTYWVSEPDKGIYYAMNKAIEKISGDWVIFMNCGDQFYCNKVLQQVFASNILPDIDIVYGNTYVRSHWGNFELKANDWTEIWKSFTHQSIFIKSSVQMENKFAVEDFVAAADYNLMYSLFFKQHKAQRMDVTISSILYSEQGFSAKHQLLSKKEVLKVIKNYSENKLLVLNFHFRYHFYRLCMTIISLLTNKLSPTLIRRIRKWRDLKRK